MIRYNNVVKEHFFKPRNIENGELSYLQPASVGSAEAYEHIQIWMDCDEEGRITKLTYKVLGNPYLIALLSLVSESLTGKTLLEAKQYSFADNIALLEIPKHKRYCVMLVEDVINVLIKRQQQNTE
jgi:nitrogen fixation NifU-like protein